MSIVEICCLVLFLLFKLRAFWQECDRRIVEEYEDSIEPWPR